MLSATRVALPADSCLDSRRLLSPATCRLHSPGWMSQFAVVLSVKLDVIDLMFPGFAASVWVRSLCKATQAFTMCTTSCGLQSVGRPKILHRDGMLPKVFRALGMSVVVHLLFCGEVAACGIKWHGYINNVTRCNCSILL